MILRNHSECERFEDFDFHSPIFIFIRFFPFTLLRQLHLTSILRPYPNLQISMSKHQGVNTSSKMDFILKTPDIIQTYLSSKSYLRIQVRFLLLQKIWRNILDDYYRLRCDAMKSGRISYEYAPSKYRQSSTLTI